MIRRAAEVLRSAVRSKKFLPILLCGGAVYAIVIGMFLAQPLFMLRADRSVYDIYLRSMSGGEPSPVPILIDIDERSIAALGQWPWPRYVVAEIIAALYEGGVASVGADFLLSEPDRTSPVVWEDDLRRYFDVDVKIAGLPDELLDNDMYLASVVSQVPAVLGVHLTGSSGDVPPAKLRSFPITELRAPGAPPLATFLPDAEGAIAPVAKIAEAAQYIGLMNAEGDEDGIFRRVPLFLSFKGEPIAGLALASLAIAAGDRSIVVRVSSDGPESVRVAGIDVPISNGGMMGVTFRGPGGTIPTYSAVDVLERNIDPELLAGRVAFFGSTASGLRDLRSTPFDNNYPGLELHAAAVDTILSRRSISEPRWTLGVNFIAVLVVGAISMLMFGASRPQIALPSCGAIVCALLGASWWVMTEHGIFVSPIYALSSVMLQAFQAFALRFWLDDKEKRVLRRAFANYVSPEIVGRIVERGGVASLQGETRCISVLFTDLRGFTTMTEKMAPTQVSALLGMYFTPMTHIVRESSGTLDKFVGDALMAFWNAPVDVPDHQLAAVRSLMEMHKALAELNVRIEPEFGLRIRMGGGIHSGDAHVGNMGTAELMDYTALGDTVNTASRLEGMCSKYGVSVVLSDDTASHCRDAYALRTLDIVRVKGKKTGIRIWTAYEHEEAETRADELRRWDDAFAYYTDGDFEKSAKICEELARIMPDEKIYQIFASRASQLASLRPQEWDGVYTYDSK